MKKSLPSSMSLKDLLPDGKIVLPAEVVVNKMGTSLVLELKLNVKKEQKK